MSIELSADQVNKFLSDAVLNSQIGDVVKKSVERAVNQLSQSYNNPFDTVVASALQELIRKELNTTYAETIKSKVATLLAAKMTDEMIDGIVSVAFEKLKRDY